MTGEFDKVEILLVEDNPTDAELSIRALQEHHPANELAWVKDGAEALDFLFRAGAYADRKGEALKAFCSIFGCRKLTVRKCCGG